MIKKKLSKFSKNIQVLSLLFLLTTTVFANPKVVLFNDTSSWYHWGCTGTSTALKEEIEQLGFTIDALPIHLTYTLKEIPSFEFFDDPNKLKKFCDLNQEIIEKIRVADAVIITGEGTIHGLKANPRHLLYLAHLAKRYFGKHVEIINHSVYPNDPIFTGENKSKEAYIRACDIYKNIYSELDFIAIREPFSQEEMKKIGIASTLSFDCLPLYIKKHYDRPKVVNEKSVLVAGSVAFTETGAEKICRYLEILSQRDYQIQVLTGAAAFPSKDDLKFVAFLKKHCKAPWQLIEATSMEEWLDTINHSTFLLSGRFHHSIAAFCLNTPFIALNSNTYKVHALCAFLGQKEPLLFADPQLLEHLLERTELLLSSKSNNQVQFEQICQLAEQNFTGLKSLRSP